MNKLLTILSLLALVSTATVGFAADALFDEGHDQQWPMSSSDKFDEARAAITGAGHTISVLNSTITLEALNDYDLFVTGTLNSFLSAAEIEALQNFVMVGGTVLVIHDGGWSSDSVTPSVNSFLAPYGIVLASASSNGNGLMVEGFSSHCLTQSINALGLDYVRLIDSISSPALDLTTGSTDILAVYESDTGGKVIALSDDSLWSDPGTGSDYAISDLDNLTMLMNIFDCLNGSVATETATWGGLKSLYR